MDYEEIRKAVGEAVKEYERLNTIKHPTRAERKKMKILQEQLDWVFERGYY